MPCQKMPLKMLCVLLLVEDNMPLCRHCRLRRPSISFLNVMKCPDRHRLLLFHGGSLSYLEWFIICSIRSRRLLSFAPPSLLPIFEAVAEETVAAVDAGGVKAAVAVVGGGAGQTTVADVEKSL